MEKEKGDLRMWIEVKSANGNAIIPLDSIQRVNLRDGSVSIVCHDGTNVLLMGDDGDRFLALVRARKEVVKI